jgi:hypothetical protein
MRGQLGRWLGHCRAARGRMKRGADWAGGKVWAQGRNRKEKSFSFYKYFHIFKLL